MNFIIDIEVHEISFYIHKGVHKILLFIHMEVYNIFIFIHMRISQNRLWNRKGYLLQKVKKLLK